MSKLKILNKEYSTELIGVLDLGYNDTAKVGTSYIAKDKLAKQRSLGMSKIYNTPKGISWAVTKGTECAFKLIIVYTNEENYLSSFLKTKLSLAVNNGCDVITKDKLGNYKRFTSVVQIETKRDKYLKKKEYLDVYSMLSLAYDINNKRKRVTDKGKVKIRKYITYYDLPMPRSEAEWVNTYIQVKYYVKNRIDFAFDKSMYKICPKCKELVQIGTEEEHVCHASIAPKRCHMDYAVNGDDPVTDTDSIYNNIDYGGEE